jgi:thiol-disulfide isomerase/thioredoxin
MTRRSALSVLAASAAVPAFAAKVPRPSPEFVVQMPEGNSLLLSSFKGKVIACEFLLTTCPHCQHTAQIIDRLYKEFGPRGFQPVGIAINDMAKMLVGDFKKQFVQSGGWPVGFSPRDPVLNYLEHSAVQQLYMPAMVFIDRKFQIRGQYLGTDDFYKDQEKNMRAMVETLMKEAGAPVSKKKSAAPKAA